MLMLYDLFISPFMDYPFMRRALVATLLLAIASSLSGVFLVIKRMSMLGDALGHGILPGIAIGFLFFGFNIMAMSIGGMIVGLLITLFSSLVAIHTNLKEDASFTAFYLLSLSFGVMIISMIGSPADLIHILFGSVLAIDRTALIFVSVASISSVLLMSIIYRPLLLYLIDPIYVRAIGWHGALYHALFLLILVTTLVAGFQALGSLMAVGLLMLPAICARLWAHSMESNILYAMLFGCVASIVGLLLSFHIALPTGPTIITLLGGFYLLSLLFGTVGGIIPKMWRSRHKTH